MILKLEQFRKRRYNQRNQYLRDGVKKKKTTNNLGTGKGGGYFSNRSSGNITAY
jgi:hypothetical protein